MESAPQTLTRKLLRVVLKPGDSSDRDLLLRFVSSRDEDAFAELVRRHGRMVLAVARRVTGHPQDAEDAFQAAFLVLARRAAQIKQPEQLANWLYGVAYRTALEARVARRRVLEYSVSALPEPTAPPPPDDASDLRRVIDEELAGLPDKYRAAVVLCDLEGLPRTEAATRLKIPEGTLSSRLAHARKVLASRLTRRGITSTSCGIVALLAQEATGGALPRELVLLTARVAVQVTAGGMVPPNLVSPSVSHLAEGAMKIMFANRLRLPIASGVLACGLLALGAYGLAQVPVQNSAQPNRAGNQESGYPNSQSAPPAKEKTKIVAKGNENDDVPSGSLPSQAVARIEEGKLIIRQRVNQYEQIAVRNGAERGIRYQMRSQISDQTLDEASEVAVFDMKGNRLLPKVWKEKLKVDNHVLLAFDGSLPNPRELTLFKEDTLLLILPASSALHPARTPPPVPAAAVNPFYYVPQTSMPQTSYVPQTTYVPRTDLYPSPVAPQSGEIYNPYQPLTPQILSAQPAVTPSPPPPSTTAATPPAIEYNSNGARLPQPAPTPVPQPTAPVTIPQPAPTPAPPNTHGSVPPRAPQPATPRPTPPTRVPQPSTPQPQQPGNTDNNPPAREIPNTPE